MAQNDFAIPNQGGQAFRLDVQDALQSLAGHSSGATDPNTAVGTTYPYQFWADTNNSVMKMRNGADSGWIELFQLDGEWSTIAFENGTAAAPSIYFKDSGTDTGFYSPGADQVGISTGGTSALVVDASQRVGIGTASPVTQCTVYGSTSAIQFQNTNTGSASGDGFYVGNYGGLSAQVWQYENDVIQFGTNNTERARIDSSGRLLVGTSTTSADHRALFQSTPADTSGFGSILVARGTSTGLSDGSALGVIAFSDSGHTKTAQIGAFVDGGYTSGTDMPSRLVFSTTADGASSPTERMRIDRNGNVGIAVTPSGSYKLEVTGSAYINGDTRLKATYPILDNTYVLGTSSFRWSVVYAATGTINTSDANQKQDVEDLDAAELSVATAIKGLIKKFRFIDAVADKGDDARIHVGVIAQEVEQAFVDAGLDPRRYGMFCEDVLEDGTKRLGIRYDELLAFVIAAL